jgi:hypothetical protein
VTKSKIPMSDNLRIRKVDCKAELFFLLAFALLFPAGLSFAAVETNKMVSMQIESSKGGPVLRIVTEKPIADFAYTAYNSGDWSRVVIAFPHMNTGAISSLTDVNQPPVQKVDVLSDNTTWGRMSWVEVVLFKAADYDVVINYNEFVLTLLRSEEQANSAAVEPVANINESVPAPVKEVTAPASTIINVDVGSQVVTLQADGLVYNYKFFSLGGPDRLVLDVYGVKPGFEARSIPLLDDFSKMRVGVHKEKLRFVFDTSGKLPKYDVTRKGESVVISWGSGTSTISEPAEETKPASVVVPAPVKEVTALAFSEEYLSGKTLYAVWFDEGNSITNHAVVAKEVFNVDGTVDITYLSNLSDTTVAYGVTSAGLLFYGNNITEGNMITCSTVNYIKSDYTINGVFDSVDIYFFEEDRAVNFANTLSNSIPQGCL